MKKFFDLTALACAKCTEWGLAVGTNALTCTVCGETYPVKNGIPILRRPELTRTIYAAVQPGQQIPQELFVAVAEILALIFRLKKTRY